MEYKMNKIIENKKDEMTRNFTMRLNIKIFWALRTSKIYFCIKIYTSSL